MTTRPPPQARTLIFDLETLPLEVYTWGVWEQNAIKVIKDWSILCFSYKWLGEPKVYFKKVRVGDKDDKWLVGELWKLFDKADTLIAHNGNSFDCKKANARFIHHGLRPPSPYKQIDTKLLAKRKFGFTFNSLNEIARYLHSPFLKVATGGFELWEGCMKNDPKAWRKMEKYNLRDTKVLDYVYRQLRPWDNLHPPVSPEAVCQKCGSRKLRLKGNTFSYGEQRQRFYCKSCGGWGQYTKKGTKNL